MKPLLDLTVRHFQRDLGDITVTGTWIGEEHEDTEPCIVLTPRYRSLLQFSANGVLQRAKPCCVALSSAYKYDDPKYLVAQARNFNAALGFEDSMQSIHRIAGILHESLDDLCRMPEMRPVRSTHVAADAVITDNQGMRRTIEIIEKR